MCALHLLCAGRCFLPHFSPLPRLLHSTSRRNRKYKKKRHYRLKNTQANRPIHFDTKQFCMVFCSVRYWPPIVMRSNLWLQFDCEQFTKEFLLSQAFHKSSLIFQLCAWTRVAVCLAQLSFIKCINDICLFTIILILFV